MVWPCNNIQNHQSNNKNIVTKGVHQNKANVINSNGYAVNVDKPLAWMKNANTCEEGYPQRDAQEEMEMDIQRQTLRAENSNRLSRSRSRHIMERAKSFERAAAEAAAGGTTVNGVSNITGCDSNANSRPGSRAGSVSRSRRSPSVGRQLGIFIRII